MSLYYDKKERVRTSIIEECKRRIEENFSELEFWLSFEDWEFPSVYETEFNKEFSQYISQDETTNTHILYAGQNVTYFVSTIISITRDIDKIKKLVDEFITTQFEDFENACDYISMTMYDESNPDTDETSIPIIQNQLSEDNPSNT